MKCVVTGGAGFIGSWLCERLGEKRGGCVFIDMSLQRRLFQML
ncbi:MAG: NAD-dependent epimerase/dehydratase family protein [ANME-2 cluster archaeon]|nr:NAD-dependent epimerase/dehydratase family protein [ANME-2 cluster archaeon]